MRILTKFYFLCFVLGTVHISLIWCMLSDRSPLDLCEVRPRFHPNGDHLPSVDSTMHVYVNIKNTTVNDDQKCLMRFTTCVNCKFAVKSESTFSFPKCRGKFDITSLDCLPGCTYLMLFDSDYSNETTNYFYDGPLQGPLQEYLTESRTLYVVMCSKNSPVRDIVFDVSLTVKEKKEVIKGSSYDSISGFKSISSPYFPAPYAENDEEYLFEFRAVNHEDYIQLVFDDWHLAPTSSVKFEYTNVQGPVMGSANRPSVLSSGPILKLHFYTGKSLTSNERKYMGFKASYKFINQGEYVQRAQTNCGGYLLKKDGGTILFSPSNNINDFYDCIWVVKVQPGYDHIYSKLESYETILEYTSVNHLEIRDGLSSKGDLKASVRPGNVDASKLHGHESKTGFYIRLRGRYKHASDFILTYASFKFGECFGDKYFKCTNRKCINSRLICDGYNHCGDNSDEDVYTCRSSSSTDSPYSYTLSVGVIIPIVISVFLIVVILLLIIFIRRCRNLAQTVDDRQRIGTVSGQTSRNRRRRARQRISMNLTISQDSPPTYEEVIRSAPIGHLNMAFMWSQRDVGMIQPPSYEEATSPIAADIPQLPPAISSSSSEATLPQASPAVSSSTDASYHRSRQVSSSSSSSNTSTADGGRWPDQVLNSTPHIAADKPHNTTTTQSTQLRTSNPPIAYKPSDDDFIAVSAIRLQDKGDSTTTPSQASPVESAKPDESASSSPSVQRECGMQYRLKEPAGETSSASEALHPQPFHQVASITASPEVFAPQPPHQRAHSATSPEVFAPQPPHQRAHSEASPEALNPQPPHQRAHSATSPEAFNPQSSYQVDPKKALHEFVARKQKEKRRKRSSDRAETSSSTSPSHRGPRSRSSSNHRIEEPSTSPGGRRPSCDDTQILCAQTLTATDNNNSSQSDDRHNTANQEAEQLYFSLQVNTDEDPDVYV